MKKTFVITMFGEPFDWLDNYVENVQFLGTYGWEWLIFTPHYLKSKGNVKFIPMNTDAFNDLVEKKLGVRPNFFITKLGVPSVHITDYYVASGVIFEDWLKDSDFWGITNMDVVYGRLQHFFPDSFLSRIDVFSDDVQTINGVFSLWRNREEVNNLFKEIPRWKEKFAQAPCGRCVSSFGGHTLFGTDEYDMTEVMKRINPLAIKYAYPTHYPLLGHDRLEMHQPKIKLELKADGSLYELLEDVKGPNWVHSRPFIGREIPYFHFQKTKKWPL